MSLVDLIEEERRAHGFERVSRVIVEIGKLGHVDPHALAFAFDATTSGTVAEGAALDIVELDGRAWCMACEALVTVSERGTGCPNCGGHQMVVEQGEDLRLKELEVA